MGEMAVAAKGLDVQVGDVVETAGRRSDVVSDRHGGVTLEPAITKTMEALRAERGDSPVSRAEFDELVGDLPRDGEG